MNGKDKIIEGMKLLKEGCKENETCWADCPMSTYCEALFSEGVECPEYFFISK